MADERPPQKSGSENPTPASPLERYLAKQKQEKSAKEASQKSKGKSPKKPVVGGLREALGKMAASQKAPSSSDAPSLHGVERPPEEPQPAALRRWESIADQRLSENEMAAREAGAPPVPPSMAMGGGGTAGPSAGPSEPAGVSPGGVAAKPGEFSSRLVAYWIDFLIVSVIGYFARASVITIFSIVMGGIAAENFVDSQGVRLLISLLVIYGYYGYFYSTKAASPGKMMMGLSIYHRDGVTKLTMGQALVRESLGKLISAIPFFMGFLRALRSDHLALHDVLFDTRVVKSESAR